MAYRTGIVVNQEVKIAYAKTMQRMTATNEFVQVGSPLPGAIDELGFPKPALIVWLRHVG